MYTDEQLKLIRNSTIIVSVVLLLIIGSFVWFIINRVGMVQVEAVVVPSDAKVTYRDGEVKNGTNYLRPGKYQMTISRSNFETKKYDITIKPNTTQIPLSTEPVNDEGEKYLEQHPDENQRYEIIGANMLRESNIDRISKYPQLAGLPKRHYSRTSVYEVANGGADVNNTPILAITNSSTQGRRDALQWIKDNGYDINSIIINYDDYDSPLTKRSE